MMQYKNFNVFLPQQKSQKNRGNTSIASRKIKIVCANVLNKDTHSGCRLQADDDDDALKLRYKAVRGGSLLVQ